MERTEKNRIISFLIYTFTISFGLYFLFLYSPKDRDYYTSFSETRQLIQSISKTIILISPAIGVIITRLTTGEGFKNLWIKPNLKGNAKYYLTAWLVPILLIVAGGFIYHLVYHILIEEPCEALSQSEKIQELIASNARIPESYKIDYINDILVPIVLGPIICFISFFGEVWGWQGYLLPKLSKFFKPIPLVLILGTIWALWSTPSTILTYSSHAEYYDIPYIGIIATYIFSIATGTLSSFLCIKTQSCIPGVLVYSVIYSTSSLAFILFDSPIDPFLGPLPTGIIGCSGFIAAAIIIAIVWHRNYKKETSINNSDEKIITE